MMSIRPINFEELPETSFEDMDTTFPRDVAKKAQQEIRKSPFSRQALVVPTPSSSTSSEGTIFSNSKDRYLQGSKTEEDEEQIGEEENFLNDFEEFQNRKDDFDDALKTFFRLKSTSTSLGVKPSLSRPISNDLANEFNRRLSITNKKRPAALRQPRSMMELKPRPRSNDPPNMPNSLSTGDLRVQSNSTVRFKKSMPALSKFNPTIEEEEEELPFHENEIENDIERYRNRYINDFVENKEEEDDEKDFVLDEELVQPQFLNRKSSEESPLKLSPSQYEIVRGDTLLTPRLHKRHREWNAREQLDSFKEKVPALSRRRSANNRSAASRMKTIKQEIDQNTPIKNGRMYYNPKTMTWEGNEQVLDKFTKLESIDKKPLLIKTKSQISEANQVTNYPETSSNAPAPGKSSSFKWKPPNKNSKSPRIVGRMMFDDENLRWVSVHGNEDERDPFAGIEDIAPAAPSSPSATWRSKKYISPFLRSHSQILPSSGEGNATDRLNSGISTRYHSVGLKNRDSCGDISDPTFQLSSKLLERFCHEENRWNRKVGGWFLLGNKDEESSVLDESRKKNDQLKSFMFEIRNMVMSSTRS